MTSEEVFLTLIALPREAGTAAAAQARTLLTGHLESLGYSVQAHPFKFQPASLITFPLIGAGLGWLTLLEVPLLSLTRLPDGLALLVWVGGTVSLGILAWGIGTGIEVPGAERREDANLVATRGKPPVRRWIVAHLDTKAQGHSLAGRLVAVWVMVLAVSVLTGLAVGRAVRGALPMPVVAAAAGLSFAAGILAVRGRLRGTSPGARDNGTGLLAALIAAEGRHQDGVGLLFTGAEEFGLVGARAFARTGKELQDAEVINLDTLTDRGALYLVYHDDKGKELARTFAQVLTGVAPESRERQLPVGILVDSIPLARAGARAITIGRLDWDDLCRLHTAGDTLEGLGLSTARAVGSALAALR